MTPTLIVLTGPTGSGKTDMAITLAKQLGCHILSADSRQIFKGIPIGTAAPTPSQLAEAHHHFIAKLELTDYYSAALYEEESLKLLDELFRKSPYAIMCGGSMMYIDAVTRGIDELPTISPEVRESVAHTFAVGGIEAIREQLKKQDPTYYSTADPSNHKRLIHALEISIEAGRPYSQLRTGRIKQRPFRILKFALDIDRETMFARINARVWKMIEQGWEAEAESVYHLRHLNSLNTVGYKDLFAMMDGRMTRDEAIARIAKNTRVYAKKQITWLRRDPDIIWIKPGSEGIESILSAL